MTTTVVSRDRLDRGRNLDPRVIFAFLAIYLLWGTTFFAIRIAVHEIPPLFAAGVRMFLAGVILLAFMGMRGAARPTRLEWRNLALMGSLMFVIDYGALFWAERYIPSGIAAVLSATVPLMTIAFEIFVFRLQPFRWGLIAAVLLGFAGVGILLLPDPRQSLPVIPCVAILLGTAAWCLGTVLSRRLVLPASRPVAAGGSMMIGGAVLLILSALLGELHPWPHASARAMFALAYLILFGSVLAFTAYVWLLGRMPASTVASYAYVNPVVAVALGYFAAGEPLTAHVVAGAALVLVSVYLILRKGRRPTRA
ncbi:EamA family transporter [Edaphobacter sp. 12200R-103]|jgi:drug/metabolite transporter (DMT)-like permease|uniref:EamA family transporter n=1 Tax=Edaphobacter sp. 12200R-103 TaxID=2703788 RepID=UPI00138B3786|nr:EamA family transporter [Edaphobacter sp. 12200R-103]QHS52601.1 EamA family transporter [Edaphobacter sp. 12200R-103]